MKKRFIVVLVIHTADSVIVIVWIIRPPVERRGDSFSQQVSVTGLCDGK